MRSARGSGRSARIPSQRCRRTIPWLPPVGRGLGNLEGYGTRDGPKGPAAPPARRPRGWPAPIPARSNVSGQGQPGRPRATRRIVLRPHPHRAPLARTDVPREPLEEIGQGFMKFRIVATAVDLRLFTRIDGRSVTVDDVRSLLKTEERPTRIFLDALAAMGLLELRRGRYRNAPATQEYLVEGRPRFYGDMLRMLARR